MKSPLTTNKFGFQKPFKIKLVHEIEGEKLNYWEEIAFEQLKPTCLFFAHPISFLVIYFELWLIILSLKKYSLSAGEPD